jgi:hypothetical protein
MKIHVDVPLDFVSGFYEVSKAEAAEIEAAILACIARNWRGCEIVKRTPSYKNAMKEYCLDPMTPEGRTVMQYVRAMHNGWGARPVDGVIRDIDWEYSCLARR